MKYIVEIEPDDDEGWLARVFNDELRKEVWGDTIPEALERMAALLEVADKRARIDAITAIQQEMEQREMPGVERFMRKYRVLVITSLDRMFEILWHALRRGALNRMQAVIVIREWALVHYDAQWYALLDMVNERAWERE